MAALKAYQPHECIFATCPSPRLCLNECYHEIARRTQEPPSNKVIVPLFEYSHDAEPADFVEAWGRTKHEDDEVLLVLLAGGFTIALIVTALMMQWVGLGYE